MAGSSGGPYGDSCGDATDRGGRGDQHPKRLYNGPLASLPGRFRVLTVEKPGQQLCDAWSRKRVWTWSFNKSYDLHLRGSFGSCWWALVALEFETGRAGDRNSRRNRRKADVLLCSAICGREPPAHNEKLRRLPLTSRVARNCRAGTEPGDQPCRRCIQ